MSRMRRLMMQAVRKFLHKREQGATAVEYSLLVAAIAAVIVGTVVSIGGKVKTAFVVMDTQLDAAASSGGGS